MRGLSWTSLGEAGVDRGAICDRLSPSWNLHRDFLRRRQFMNIECIKISGYRGCLR